MERPRILYSVRTPVIFLASTTSEESELQIRIALRSILRRSCKGNFTVEVLSAASLAQRDTEANLLKYQRARSKYYFATFSKCFIRLSNG